jgi:hypothetical protein
VHLKLIFATSVGSWVAMVPRYLVGIKFQIVSSQRGSEPACFSFRSSSKLYEKLLSPQVKVDDLNRRYCNESKLAGVLGSRKNDPADVRFIRLMKFEHRNSEDPALKNTRSGTFSSGDQPCLTRRLNIEILDSSRRFSLGRPIGWPPITIFSPLIYTGRVMRRLRIYLC